MTYFHPLTSDSEGPRAWEWVQLRGFSPAAVRRVKLAASKLSEDFPEVRIGANFHPGRHTIKPHPLDPNYPSPIYNEAQLIVWEAITGGEEQVSSAYKHLGWLSRQIHEFEGSN